MINRIKIVFSYDGSKFFGSQIQKSNIPTVAGTLQKSFKILGLQETAYISGRTDKGVHALNQVCHIDIPSYFSDLEKFRKNLNHIIAPYIYIKKITFVKLNFHARFSAKQRLYRYIVAHKPYNPLFADYFSFMPRIDLDSLNNNIKKFEGTHNFKYFKKNGSVTYSDTRTIYKAFAYQKQHYTIINFLGNSFLRSQIRMMCQFLFDIEKGKLNDKELNEQLNLENKICTSLAPPQGLYLSRIYY